MSYQLNQAQLTHIQNLVNAEDYHLAYRYIAEQIEDAVQNEDVSRETQRWFEWAEQINGDYDSFINRYSRTFAKLGASKNGETLTNEEFQAGSDAIALEVLNDILSSGAVPTTPKDIILIDIARGSEEMGTDPEDFPGTLIANMLFDTDTIGELILNDPNGTTWAEIAKSGEQVVKHALLLGSIGLGGLLEILQDPTRLGDIFDAAMEVTQSETFRDILGEIAEDAGAFFQDISDDYGWAWENPGTILREILPDWVGNAQTQWRWAPNITSPICLDLDGDGVELTSFSSLNTTTFFDLNNDGFAEQTAWITANNDGLLARDTNENGIIDNGGELFGSPSVDGFAILAQLDSNQDLKIDANDAAWNELVIWKDTDGDAVTDSGELHSLASLDIASIDLAGVTPSTSTISGNPISHTTTYKLDNGTVRTAVDAWFVHDKTNSFYNGDYTLDVRTLFLPTLRGFGQLPDLHIAMSQNEDLLGLVQTLVTGWDWSKISDDQSIIDILYEWAGVSDVSPSSRGAYIDARKLEFMESFFGNEFSQGQGSVGPGPGAAAALESVWGDLLQNLKTHLLAQAGAGTLFNDTSVYDAWAGEITGELELSQTAIEDLVGYSTASGVDTEGYWFAIARFLDSTKGIANLTASEEGWLDDAAYESHPALSWEFIANFGLTDPGTDSLTGTSGDDTITGFSSHDTIYGLDGNDTLYGMSGNDTLYGDDGDDTLNGGDGDDLLFGAEGTDTINGGNGNDTLYSGTGNDTLDGGAGDDLLLAEGGNNTLIAGAGNDTVYGRDGDDIYYYTSGDDFYTEVSYSGADEIRLPEGITIDDIAFQGTTGDGLFIIVDGLGRIQIDGQYTYGGSGSPYAIETLRFYDNSTVDLLTLTNLTFHGTDGAEEIRGNNLPSGMAVEINGYAGNDSLYGSDNDDIIDGGDGNDYLVGQYGNDTYVASAGFDIIAENASAAGDTILIPDGYDAGDLTLFRNANDELDLQILITGLGEIEVQGQFWLANGGIEHIAFANGDPSIDIEDVSITTVGTAGDDTFGGVSAGASPNNILDGREGNDYLYSFEGDDIYVASQGSDTVSDTGGADHILFKDGTTISDLTLYRTGLFDLVISHVNGDQIKINNHFYPNSQGGHDYSIESILFQNETSLDLTDIQVETRGTQNADSIGGITNWSNLNDIIYGYAGIDNLQGGDGDDVIYGGDDIDYIYGNADDDTLDGGAGNDTLYGDDGNDLLIGGAGDDTINGGIGNDTVSYAATTSGVTVNLAAGSDQATGTETGTDQISNVENVIGGSGNDVISGDSGSNILDGGAGNDILNGDAGDDVYHYNGGTDFITETSGFDVLEINFGVDDVTDVQFRRFTSAIDDLTVYIDNGVTTGSITVSGHFSSTDLQVEQVRLAPGWDLADLTDMRVYTICDTATSEIIYGVDYYLSGGAGNQDDTFFGNVTQDFIAAGSGNDSIWAGDGDDVILGGGGGDGILGEEGDDIISGEDGDDFIFGDGDGTETYSGNDIIYGGAGEDWIEGGGGIDYIYGGDDDDILFGQGGNDLLYGGDGYDALVGGDGADTFVFENDTAFSGIDTIYEFTSGSGGDVIDLNDILTGYNSATDQLEDFLQFATSGSDTTVSVDVDGTSGGTSWTQIALIAGVTGITDEDALVASGNLVV